MEKNLTWNEKNTIYISEPGIYSLLTKSEKQKAEPFQDFIFEELLPSLRETGSYNMNNKVTLDTCFIVSFYDLNSISDYIDYNVVYIGVIGIYEGGLLCKFGLSKRIFDRDYNEHRETFGEQFKMVLILKTDNNDNVETKFKKEMQIKGIDRKLPFNGKLREELFVTTDKFNLQDAMDLMKKIVDTNPLEAIKQRDDKIKELEYKFDNDKEILIEKEKTKQKELDFKKMELEYKILELKMKNKKNADTEENIKKPKKIIRTPSESRFAQFALLTQNKDISDTESEESEELKEKDTENDTDTDTETENKHNDNPKIKKPRSFTIDLLNDKIKKDGAILVGEYPDLCKKSKITFICKCKEKNTKNILVILDKGGAICKKCTNAKII